MGSRKAAAQTPAENQTHAILNPRPRVHAALVSARKPRLAGNGYTDLANPFWKMSISPALQRFLNTSTKPRSPASSKEG